MKITYHEIHRAIHIKEFFTKEEYDEMWFELSNLCNDEMLSNSEKSGGARNARGELLRFNRGLFIDSVMSDSCIIKYMNKLFEKEIFEELMNYNQNYGVLQNNKIHQSNLINHYMGGHSYNFHKDNALLTVITVFHKTPKPYTGGVLTFRENNSILEVELEPRDLVIFGSVTDHAVSPIVLNEDVKSKMCFSDEGLVYQKAQDIMNGRISVSKFIGQQHPQPRRY
jgi:hypothetical protein